MEKVINEKVSIMIELLMVILNCKYSDAYNIIVSSVTYKYLKNLDYATLHDSPQANLSEIGKELRQKNDSLGNKITDENIINAVRYLRNKSKEIIGSDSYC